MNKQEFLRVTAIIETVLNKPMTEAQIEIYYKILGNKITVEQFETGLYKLFLDRVYTNIPAPAEILQYCTGKKKVDIKTKCIEAKRKFREAITVTGVYESYVFDDPIIHRMIKDNGGIIRFGGMDMVDFENFLKFEFDKLYENYAQRDNLGNIPVVIGGRSSLINQREGIEHKENVICIGNKETCSKWTLAYFNKNHDDELNQINYFALGYIAKPQLEYKPEITELDLSNGKEFVGKMLVEHKETQQSKPEPVKIEYTPEQLKSYIPEKREKKPVKAMFDTRQLENYNKLVR